MLDIRTKTIDRKSLKTFTNETKLKKTVLVFQVFSIGKTTLTHTKKSGPQFISLD